MVWLFNLHSKLNFIVAEISTLIRTDRTAVKHGQINLAIHSDYNESNVTLYCEFKRCKFIYKESSSLGQLIVINIYLKGPEINLSLSHEDQLAI